MSGYDGEDAEPTETHSSLPFIWECIKPEVHDEPEEDEVSKSKNRRGPRVGKLLQYLNSIEDQEELEAKVVERDPESGQSLLLWATKHEKFLVVEWLIKKCGRAAFAFQDNEQEVTIYNKWKEIRKEEEERERKRIERAKAKESNKDAQAEEEEDDEENGQDASSKPTHVAVYEQLSDVLSQFSQQQALARIQAIGNLGLYQGNRSELGIKESLGQCMYPNGDMYIGEYQSNTRHGIGTYAWNNAGILYIGHWKEGMRCGLGRIVYADGGRYYGSWWADERSGHGQYTYPNGDIYTGEWYRNERSGSGTLTFCSDGSKYVGIWERHGQFLRGEWCMPCGMKYIGSFENMKPAGHGFFVFSNGTYQEGSWTPKTGALSESVWSPKNVGSVYNGVHAKGVLLSHGTWKEALTPQITIRGFEIRLTGELSAGGFTRLLDVTSMRGLRRWIDQQPRDVPQCEREPIQILDLRMDRFVSSHAQWLRAKVSPELTLDVYEDSVALAVVLIPNSRLADARILLCSDTWYHPEQKEEDTNSSQCLVPPRAYLTGAREYDGQFIRSFCAVHLLNPSKAKNKSGTVSSSESAVQLTFPLRTESDTRVLPPLEEEKESALNIETSVVEHVDYRLFVHPVQDAFIWKQLVDTSESGGLRWIEDASLPGIRLVPLQEAIQSYESVDNASAHTRVVPRELLRRVKQYMDNNGGTLPSQTTQQRLRPLTPPPPMLFTELPVVEPLIEPPKRTTQEVDQE